MIPVKKKIVQMDRPTLQASSNAGSGQANSGRKITSLSTDLALFEKAFRKVPSDSDRSGDMRYPGFNGLWGEWIASERRWTEGRFYVSGIRGFEKTKRMSFSKAWTIRCLRMGLI